MDFGALFTLRDFTSGQDREDRRARMQRYQEIADAGKRVAQQIAGLDIPQGIKHGAATDISRILGSVFAIAEGMAPEPGDLPDERVPEAPQGLPPGVVALRMEDSEYERMRAALGPDWEWEEVRIEVGPKPGPDEEEPAQQTEGPQDEALPSGDPRGDQPDA